jgi:hypothetical protein
MRGAGDNVVVGRAVVFNLEGKALEILPRAYRLDDIQLMVGGRHVSPEILDKIISRG